jgi:mRNA interferase MazF
MTSRVCSRGEIYLADLSPVVGSEQGGRRPVLIIQNDVGNRYAPTVIIAPLTTSLARKDYPTSVFVKQGQAGLDKDSVVLLNQIRTIDKTRLEHRFGELVDKTMAEVDRAIRISLGLIKV